MSIGSEPLVRIGAADLTTLLVEALERQGWRRAAKRSAEGLGATAVNGGSGLEADRHLANAMARNLRLHPLGSKLAATPP